MFCHSEIIYQNSFFSFKYIFKTVFQSDLKILHISFIAEAKFLWKSAQNFSCGDNSQIFIQTLYYKIYTNVPLLFHLFIFHTNYLESLITFKYCLSGKYFHFVFCKGEILTCSIKKNSLQTFHINLSNH